MWKKLVSLNLAFVLIISMLPFGAVATEVQSTDEAPEKKLIVDGAVYDATQNHSGDGWEYFYRVDIGGVSAGLWLTDYTGGSIASDIETNIFYEGQNTILATENYGIYCGRNLSVDGSYQRASHLSVTGANDCPAVYAKGALSIGEVFTAAGDNTSALISEKNIYIQSGKVLEILAGSDAASAIKVDNYTGQNYVSTAYQKLTLVLNGAGGYTVDQESTFIQTVDDFDVWLEDYAFLFAKPGASLIGWKDEDGSIYGTKQHFSIGNSPTFLTALWDDGDYASITLQNFYGYYDYGNVNGNTSLIGGELTVPFLPGAEYELPTLKWSGINFSGWMNDNGDILSAGSTIAVNDHMTFTAQVEELYFEIDGETYSAARYHSDPDWSYDANDDYAHLDIRKTYIGSTIKVPTNVGIHLDTSITGQNGESVISVDGNVSLHTSCADLIVLTGGEGASAVTATKEVHISISNRGNSFILQGGGSAPAIQANSVDLYNDNIFIAGEDAEQGIVTDTYSGQHYVRVDPSPRTFTLNNYYGIPENDPAGNPLMGETLYVSLSEGSRYTLPDITWTGIELVGWQNSSGDIIPAGTSIFVSYHAAFTAIIKESYVEIGGEEYPASKPASGTGWSYEPGKYESTLIISEDYDGSPIKVPNDVQIELAKSLIGENGQSAITVNGNAAIHATAEASGTGRAKVSLTGGSGAPAVTATGKLRLWAFGDSDLIVQAGASAESAIQAEEVVIYDRIFYTGDDASTLSTVGRYSGEKYVELQGISQHQISVSTGELVPEVPEHAYWAFVMWRDITNGSNDDSVWYAPGDCIEGEGEKLLEAKYIYANDAGSAFVYDGNGAKTENGSNYHIVFASPSNLRPYYIADNAFVNDEAEFEEYNSQEDGNGTSFGPGALLAYDNDIRVYMFYAQWRENTPELPDEPGTEPDTPDTEPDQPDEPNDKPDYDDGDIVRPSSPTTTTRVTNDDGSVTTTVTNKTTGTITETTKYSDGTTKEIISKKDGTITTTETRPDGVVVQTVSDSTGKITATITLPKDVDTATVTLPVESLNMTTVAVNTETGEIVKKSVPTEEGMRVTLDESTQLILVDNAKTFSDTTSHWASEAINYVTSRELFNGTNAALQTFSPDGLMSRSMLMTVLARLDGVDTSTGATWDQVGMEWAKENGISDGTGGDRSVSRQELVTMMYRYAGSPMVDIAELADMSAYPDGATISDWAQHAMAWAISVGIINGRDSGVLDPQGTATRAEVAAVLMRFIENL